MIPADKSTFFILTSWLFCHYYLKNKALHQNLQKLSGLLEPSKPTQKRQGNGKNDNLSNSSKSRHIKNTNDKQDENCIVDNDERPKKIHKNKINNSKWRFWRYFN